METKDFYGCYGNYISASMLVFVIWSDANFYHDSFIDSLNKGQFFHDPLIFQSKQRTLISMTNLFIIWTNSTLSIAPLFLTWTKCQCTFNTLQCVLTLLHNSCDLQLLKSFNRGHFIPTECKSLFTVNNVWLKVDLYPKVKMNNSRWL